MSDIADLRPNIDPWVELTYPGGSYFAKGGQRLVYRLPNETAALKIWPMVPPDQHERHVREIAALAGLDHPSLPGIVDVLETVDIGNRTYSFYLEQWLDATSIDKQLARLPLDRTHFNRVARTTADAVKALHGANIVHRDVSLGNVLCDQQRGFVIDLGLAKHLDLDSLTAPGVHAGLTKYTASPEQLQGNPSDLTSSTDIFSLGVVLAHILEGKHPFLNDGESCEPGTYLARLRSHDVMHMPTDDVGALITEMLNPVAMYRPSAQDVVEALS